MRFTRLLLLIVAAAAIAGIAVPSAGALTFPDDICPVIGGTVIKLCPQGEVGKPYSYQIKGRDGTGCVPYVSFKSVGTMPPGLSISSDGLISGTPTQTGDYIFFIQMQDIPSWQGGIFWCGDDASTEKQFQISVIQGLQIQQRQSVLTPGQLTVPYNLQFTAAGGAPSWTVSAGTLPAGLTLSSAGLLAGTPTAAGDYSFKVTATAGSRSDSQTYSMSVVPKLQIAPASGVTEVGIALRLAPQATGGRPTYTWSLGGGTTLPSGLTLDPASGAITGKPTTPGRSAVQLVVTDKLGLTATLNITFTVVDHLLLARQALATAHAGRAYSVRFAKTGGARPFKWTVSGAPRGLKANAATGQLTGTPRAAGTYRLRVRVTDALGASATHTYVLKVAG
jgi:hypothetical protein